MVESRNASDEPRSFSRDHGRNSIQNNVTTNVYTHNVQINHALPHQNHADKKKEKDSHITRLGTQRCRFCGKWRDPTTVPKNLAHEVWANDCFTCRAQAGEGALGIKTSGKGVCKFCHGYFPKETAVRQLKSGDVICRRCDHRVQNPEYKLPSDRPLFYYCSDCSGDMFPPSNDALPSFTRCCHECHTKRLMKQLNLPQYKYCHACHLYAGRWRSEGEKDKDDLVLCYHCETSPKFANNHGFGITYLDKYRSRPRSIMFGSSSYWNTSTIYFGALPVRRHSITRKDLDEREQKMDKRRKRDPRQVLVIYTDLEFRERERVSRELNDVGDLGARPIYYIPPIWPLLL